MYICDFFSSTWFYLNKCRQFICCLFLFKFAWPLQLAGECLIWKYFQDNIPWEEVTFLVWGKECYSYCLLRPKTLQLVAGKCKGHTMFCIEKQGIYLALNFFSVFQFSFSGTKGSLWSTVEFCELHIVTESCFQPQDWKFWQPMLSLSKVLGSVSKRLLCHCWS